MTAIHYISFSQFCKGASEVCNMKTSIKTLRFSRVSEQTSTRNICRTSDVPGMAEAAS